MAGAGHAPLLTPPRLHVAGDAEALARHAAEAVAETSRDALSRRGVFTITLAGGETPRRLYERLAEGAALDASRTEFFWGDERPVPPTHPDSNFAMARAALLAPLGVAPDRIHRIEAERADLDAAARDYECELARLAGGEPGAHPPPLDLVLLGMGADGHTASLFPHTAALAETRLWVVANEVPALGTRRITITFPVIERARAVFFLVSGESKADALAQVLEGPWDPERLPSQRLRARADTVSWFVDAPAARHLAP
jgi:6-phosphogluconolactonase